MNRTADMSPRFKGRLAGVFQFLEGLTSAFGQVIVLGKVVVVGNAAATAASILAHEQLFWWGFASSIIGAICHVVWALLMYELMKVVNRTIALLAAFVIIVGCAMQALTGLLYIVPLLILQGGSSLGAFTAPQVQSLAYVFIKLNSYAFDVDLVFFGLWCILTGYLIFKSTFLPRVMGVLLAIDGLGWLLYLYPPFAYRMFPVVATAAALAEIPLELWLMVAGVNPERWKEQASTLPGS